jgi:hypothetical protein
MEKVLAEADAGDYHFELRKRENGTFSCRRSDISDPVRNPEEVKDLQEIPQAVFNIFNRLMH